MSHHDDSSGHDAGHAHPPPGIPTVKDEAGDTPPWVPKLGVALGLALLVFAVFLAAQARRTADEAAPAADEATEGVAQ